MYKANSKNAQARARQASRKPVSDRDAKINAKVAKRNAANKQRFKDDLVNYNAKYRSRD